MSGSRAPKLLLAAAVALVLLAVGLSLAVLDSPAEQRRLRLDLQRCTDLGEIARAVESERQSTGSLPADLDAVDTSRLADKPRRDPITGEPYVYRPTGQDTYELCADFDTTAPSDDDARPSYFTATPRFGQHPAGSHCFVVELQPLPASDG